MSHSIAPWHSSTLNPDSIHEKGSENSSLVNGMSRLNSSSALTRPQNLTPPNRSRSPSPSRPLLTVANHQAAPLARLELDDDSDEREVVNQPYPGVDDGFFTNGDNDKPEDESGNPEVELVPVRPRDPEDMEPHVPDITPRLGPDGGSGHPEKQPPPAEIPKAQPQQSHPEFPQSPGFRPWGWDLEIGSGTTGDSIPDLNVYQQKKTLAQGMMDIALFSANANQLRYVLETFSSHPYYYPSVALISVSLILQVAVGICLIWNATYNIKDQKALCVANRVNNGTTICVFLVTVINVFISAFGVAPAPP